VPWHVPKEEGNYLPSSSELKWKLLRITGTKSKRNAILHNDFFTAKRNAPN
jgi:hypothetical protein